ncbi:hypothetical protein I3843_10G099000, partial [Carya illinoinensis]
MCQRKSLGGMGFKDLRSFNLALLAKQGWRLPQDENSLMHKLFKAKYFPNIAFMQAGLGGNPSYAWRGIWEARKWLVARCKWRIGDGKSVNIWQDQWIPGHISLLIEAVVISADSRFDTVASLFVTHEKMWDINKFRSLFNPNIVADILKVFLCPTEMEDRMVWPHERNGQFSVRS